MSYLYLGIAIFAEIVATSLLKASEGFTRFVPTVILGVGYLVAFYCLSMALKEIPTGIAYAIW
ncbi:DMT family transporter, partial [Gluconobacter albidus]